MFESAAFYPLILRSNFCFDHVESTWEGLFSLLARARTLAPVHELASPRLSFFFFVFTLVCISPNPAAALFLSPSLLPLSLRSPSPSAPLRFNLQRSSAPFPPTPNASLPSAASQHEWKQINIMFCFFVVSLPPPTGDLPLQLHPLEECPHQE